MPQLFDKHIQSEHADSIAAYLPGGRLFEGAKISGTNFRNFILGLAKELSRAEEYLRSVASEYDISTTSLFIEEWEAAVGIPDDCFLVEGQSLAVRRRNVLIKIASLGIQTAENFEYLASLFGVTADVYQGADRFTIKVDFSGVPVDDFPYTFPIVFGNPNTLIIECLFNKLKPANCVIVYEVL